MERTNSHDYCVIMCGGVGSRFWPFSRTSKPKQFLDFFGTGRSLLQMTLDRVSRIVDMKNVIIMTNMAYKELIREQLPEVPEENILAEPARCNTAPCICWAAHHLQALDPNARMLIVPSDHLILKENAWVEAVNDGLEFVDKTGALLTLGIKPSNPNTGYGYIQRGKLVDGAKDIMKVKSFTEKPDRKLAEFFLSSGEFFWNAGIFMWRADAILKAFDIYDPETAAIFNSDTSVYGTDAELDFINEHYHDAPRISIDYAVMEKADNVYVKTVDLGWSDLGTWKALYDVSPRTRDGNVTQNCNVLTHDCSGSIFAVNGDKIVVAAGLKDYIIADNGNALLIYPIADEQNVRHLVNEIQDRFGDEYI